MLFDAAAFEANVNDFSKRNDPDAFERFLLDEIIRLTNGGYLAAGGESPDEKDRDALLADEAAFQATINQGSILCYTALANLYRSVGLWPQCFDVHDSLAKLIENEGLSDTQIGLSAFLNEAYARIDAGQNERASMLLEKAKNVPCDDPVVLSRIYDAQAALCASAGDLVGAKEASLNSVECAKDGARDAAEYATMVMNHVAMLARMGDNTDAASAADDLIERDDIPGSLMTDLSWALSGETVAVSVWDSPSARVMADLSRLTDATLAMTVTAQVAVLLPSLVVTVMVAVPAFTAVTLPF